MIRTAVIWFVAIVAAKGGEREKCLEILRNQSICCDIEDFFNGDECKIGGYRTDGSDPRKPYIFSCTFDECIFDKNKLLSSDKSIDEEAISKFLDNYLASQPTAAAAVADIREYCLNGKFKEYIPTSVCDSVKFGICAASNFAMECPKWKHGVDCNALVNVTRECKLFMNEEIKHLTY